MLLYGTEHRAAIRKLKKKKKKKKRKHPIPGTYTLEKR
jgi:hypothetical protein